MNVEKNEKLNSIIKEFTIQNINREGVPVRIDNHTSLGPFVRITETGSLNYIYVTVFFDSDVVKGKPEEFTLTATIVKKQLDVLITPKQETDTKAEKQCLLTFILTIDDDEFDKVTQVNVRVNFNDPNGTDIEPTRGTVLIKI